MQIIQIESQVIDTSNWIELFDHLTGNNNEK